MLTDFDSGIATKGNVIISLYDEQGILKTRVENRNLVVSAGRNYIASLMANTSTGLMTHMAIGSNNTTPAAGNTALGTELGRVALASITPNNNTVKYTATFGAGVGTGTVREAGIFNNSTGGTMLARVTFGDITKGASDSLTIEWTITIN